MYSVWLDRANFGFIGKCYITLISSFFANYERTLLAYFQFAQMDLARATLVLIRVLRTLINSIAKNLHKLQICLRFYSFYKELEIRAN